MYKSIFSLNNHFFMLNSKSKPMSETTGHVYTTTDYHLFKQMEGNRKLNKLHLKRLEKSMSEKYLFSVIIVNENLEIVDGNHRFEVIRKLGLKMNYIICAGYGLNEVHIFNQNAKTWNSDDYMDGYCDLGLHDYIVYRQFKKRYNIGHSESIALLSGVHSQYVSAFYSGEFKVKDYADACYKMDCIEAVGKYYAGNKRRSFIFAMMTLLKNQNFSIKEFMSKLAIQPTALVDCVSTSAYISLIEDIYNYRRREKVNLRY